MALAVSSAVAALAFWILWPHVRGEQQALRFHEIDRSSTAPAHAAADPAGDDPSDPRAPEHWRYYLDPGEAERCFGLKSQANVVVYDPWTYFRDIGNRDEAMRWPERPEKHYTWKTNSLGCREDHELDAPPRDVRVLVAGDSHTCGLCNDDESFPNLLEARLARAHAPRTVEVLNAALGGYSFHEYLGTLLRFRAFAPRVLVVSVFGGNDFSELLLLDHQFTGRPWSELSEAQLARRDAALELSAPAMGQGFNSLDTFRVRPEEEERTVRAAGELCGEMQRVAAAHGTELIVVFLPSPLDLQWPRMPKRARDAWGALEFTPEDMEINRRMGAAFLEELRVRGICSLDMRPIFEHEPAPPFWLFDFHLNLRGHELVAEALAPLVEEELR